LNNTIQIK